MAQIDATTHSLAAHRLGVLPVELPSLRFVRGDATYGYKLRAKPGDFVPRTALAVLEELRMPRQLTRRAVDQPESRSMLQLVGSLHRNESVCAFQHVAHAYRKPDEHSAWPAVKFALATDSTAAPDCLSVEALRPEPPPPPPPASAPPPVEPCAPAPPTVKHRPPSSRPSKSSSRPPPPPPTVERVLLTNAPSAHDSPITLEMPLARLAEGVEEGCGDSGRPPLDARGLHAWLHWAALPKVAQLRSAADTAVFLREVRPRPSQPQPQPQTDPQ